MSGPGFTTNPPSIDMNAVKNAQKELNKFTQAISTCDAMASLTEINTGRAPSLEQKNECVQQEFKKLTAEDEKPKSQEAKPAAPEKPKLPDVGFVELMAKLAEQASKDAPEQDLKARQNDVVMLTAEKMKADEFQKIISGENKAAAGENKKPDNYR